MAQTDRNFRTSTEKFHFEVSHKPSICIYNFLTTLMSVCSEMMMGIGEWLAHYRLNASLENYLLLEFGISLVEDLEDLFKDEALLDECKGGMSKTDCAAFVKAYEIHRREGASSSQKVEKKLNDLSLADPDLQKKKQDKKIRKIKAVEDRLAKLASMDFLIMLDCTGSMCAYLDAAKSRIRFIVQAVGETYPNIPLRFGFIGYRDIFDKDRVVVLPFQKDDLDVFEAQLSAMCASGGNVLTDLTSALKVASELDWSSAIRVLFHIGDYPCRGHEYHNLPEYEVNPPGDPRGYRPEVFVRALSEMKVKYCFGRLTSHTDKMITVLNKLVGSDYIKSAPMNSITIMDVISSSITSLLTSLLSSSSSTDSPDSLTLREYTIVEAAPVWATVPAERAVTYSRLEVVSVEQLCEEVESAKIVDDFQDVAPPLHVRCAEQPFGQGRSKLAYYARIISTNPQRVLKQSLYSSKTYTAKEKFEEYMAPQRTALFLAETYNEVRPVGTPLIEFVATRLLQFPARPGKPYFIEEPYIPGQWERFNNNTGYCAPVPSEAGTDHRAVQAFSHWTYHASDQQLIVVDCQGCFDAARNAFVLTDPAVHSVSLLAYGGTNMGKKGFERFFQTHRCNDVCRDLGLFPEAVVSG